MKTPTSNRTGEVKLPSRDDILKSINSQPITGNSTKDYEAAFRFAENSGHIGSGGWAIIRDVLHSRFNAPKTELNQIHKEAMRKYDKQYSPDSNTIMKVLNNGGYVIQMNDLDDSIYVNGERMNDGIRAEIMTSAQDQLGMRIARIENAYTAYAHQHRFNPIIDYFQALPAWDEKERIALLLNSLNLDHKLQEMIVFRWLLGVVGKVVIREQNFMLVLDGKQGTGKSYWARWINPIALHVEGTFNPGNKDHMFRLCGNLIWELGELQAITRKADRESLKSAITQKHVTDRLPYGHMDITKPITVSFVGTINNTGVGFLNDPTGNRRFAVVKSSGINWEYTEIDKNQLWAELWHKYQQGDRGKLTPDEAACRDKYNMQYEDVSAAAELFAAHFSFAVGGNVKPLNDVKSEWTASEIVVYLTQAKGLGGVFAKNKADIEEHLRMVGIQRERDFSRNRRDERSAPWVYKNIWSNDWQ